VGRFNSSILNSKDNISIQEVPEPRINPDEVLMKVWAAGSVGGSDLLIEDDRAKVNDDLCIPMCPIDYKKLYNNDKHNT